jgi:hypothetical protein
MKSLSIPIENYNIDVSEPQERWQNSVNNKLKDITRKPRNVAGNCYKKLYFQELDRTQTVFQQALESQSGFYSISGDFFFPFNYNYLPKPQKLANINSVLLDVNVVANIIDAGGYSPPGGISNFTIDFYLSLYVFEVTDGNLYPSSLSTDILKRFEIAKMVSIPFTFSILASDPLGFTIGNPSQQFNLFDTAERAIIDNIGSPDFTTNPTKITPAQLELLTTNNTTLVSIFGYNETQYTALSAANKSLFDDMFNLGLGGGTLNLVGLGVEGEINYFGTLASFVPV